ncbi:Mechanosensitive ion channel [Desulfocicer vacuolatum DSM 3385]|uniref:Mechanosensitive ion channel n=1 Tax=Desulfocicer vacuolatum DSM 3385 TaxID=1121400 RepID=A0A1W2AYR8_9BACT|nr:mechanosensitive ion channel domain-containing protein [Desulfocicer vacuolatum]SMC65833.1 Mechanosensitive ion channel [Desulfocicer vacuolatum DSM 3385]
MKKTILFWAFCFICLTSLSFAQPPAGAPSVEDKPILVQFDQAVEAAKDTLGTLEEDFLVEKKIFEELMAQQQVYRTQINSLRNFLIVPDISTSVIGKGLEEVDITTTLVQSKLEKSREREEKIHQNLSGVHDKIILIDERIKEAESMPGEIADGDSTDRAADIKKFKTYRVLLEKQKKVLHTILDVVTLEIESENDLLMALKELRVTLKKELKDRKGGRLLQRNEIKIKTFFPTTVVKEMMLCFSTVKQLFSREQLSLRWNQLQEQTNLKSIVILGVFLLICFFFRKSLKLMRHKQGYAEIISRRTGYPIIVFEDALFYIFWICLTVTLSKSIFYVVFPDIINFFKTLLIVALCTKIATDSMRLIVNEKGHELFKALFKWKNAFVMGVRFYTLVYLLFYRFLSLESSLLVLIRIGSEIILVMGVFLFWRDFAKAGPPSSSLGIKLLNIWSKAVVVAGLFTEIAGYGYFSAWWYISWGISIVILCVCVLLFYSMKDIDRKFKDKFESDSRQSHGVFSPLYWLFSNSIYCFIVAFAVIGFSFSWGISDLFFPFLWENFNRQYAMGNFQLSLAGCAYFLLVILATYFFIRLWKRLMTAHVLKESGMSTGAKESVISISIYIIWGGGILIGLNVFGLDTTSLTVAFGALSIGLGFGLQNIFSNFISGLILLFERPIQVGDVVEVADIWGEVKKINVRSTLVQTYTNSSLIIPNSEFISAKVVNWSHQDPYIRRDLLVGVAYGSDTGLVKELLLKAADSVKHVYSYPRKPMVLFFNFGESSLDFKLRFWSGIDDFVTAESDLRFEIDKLFREHDVVIPFPQRDLHIMDVSPKAQISCSRTDSLGD